MTALQQTPRSKTPRSKTPHSTAADEDVAEKKFHSVTNRVKETWFHKRNAELCELSAKDPSQFWKAFKAPQSNACPVELSAKFEAFKAWMGAEPQSAPQRPADSVASTSCSDDACLNADITVDELSQCIKRLKRCKSPGIDGILADMIQDGGAGGTWCSWQNLWTSSSLCMHTTAQQCDHHKAFLPSSDVSWG
ncbi:TPA: hypothetical protein ACH3X1_013227 [Trebouxia sp. C0004]